MDRYLKQFKSTELIQLTASGVIGLIICLMASAIGNAVLVEISINIVFSAYFGICFIIIGILLLMRVNNLPENSQLQKNKKFLQYFGIMVLSSGIICFCLERDWNKTMGYYTKIPLYVVLGVSLNFTLIFGFVDTINFVIGFFQQAWQRTLVETPNQIINALFISTLIGFIYGLFFSAMDIEDIRNFNKLESRLIFEEKLCMPIVGFLGLIGGVANEYLRIRGDKFMPYTFEQVKDPFTEEI
ncbi:unnamed protein product (macronuclear) [Paramecium tetraurelia]|uniref:Uncharacterized protein n=1 Tax=Paramecium tetraurelia TaxID=5888 RepID=A0C1Y0_PARTE|nr:uncharacterized protein GSPATT00034274001 [Paramecium tetraurelia]CAK64797.1 unnamed protein product [Paramecium tetraurelia]|eukprot:XP_001432194.1 hypothetical protein (macronuclear) [Paramecium tetraurelia strain d4-2]